MSVRLEIGRRRHRGTGAGFGRELEAAMRRELERLSAAAGGLRGLSGNRRVELARRRIEAPAGAGPAELGVRIARSIWTAVGQGAGLGATTREEKP